MYILGVTEPLSSFDGQIIGVVRRHDDCEDKLVAAPAGISFSPEAMEKALFFQEQYFDHSIEAFRPEMDGQGA